MARRRFTESIAAGYTIRDRDLTYPGDNRPHAQFSQELDRATLHLLWAVHTHRERGEEGIETEATLRGTGLSVTSSLAAAVAQYHGAVLGMTESYLTRPEVWGDDDHPR